MQITYFLLASKNIDFDHVRNVVFLIHARDIDVWINHFCPMKQFRWQSAIFLKFITFFCCKVSFNKFILLTICQMQNYTISNVLHKIPHKTILIVSRRE